MSFTDSRVSVLGDENIHLLTSSRFYAPWCGHCKNLKPAYEKAAKSLEGLAQVAAVNCDDESNKAFCGTMGVKGFPTLKTIKPTGNKNRPIIVDYQGERSAKAIVDAVKAMIPNHVTKVADKDLDKWLEEDNSTSKAILFSNKGTTSGLMKALSTEFYGNMHFAQIRDKDTAAVSTFGITSYPTLLVLPGGKEAPVTYSGEMEKEPISAFLAQYAATAAEPAGPKPADSKDAKQKPMKDKKAASSSDASTFSKASAAHSSSEASGDAASGTTITVSENEATPSPDPNVVPTDVSIPISLPDIAPPLPTLSSQQELQAKCLGPKTPTCILALLPPSAGEDTQLPESATEALASLGSISEKHKVRGSHLFPFFAIPADNEGGEALRNTLKLGDGVQLVAVNGRRGWYRTYDSVKAHGLVEVEGWVDDLRLGEGKKENLPEGLVVDDVFEELDVESATDKMRGQATDKVANAANSASEKAADATSIAKGKLAQATDAVGDTASSATDAAADATDAARETLSQATEAAGDAASSVASAATEKVSSATDAAADATDTAKEKLSDTSDAAASAASTATDKASDATEAVKDKAAQATNKVAAAASSASAVAAEKASQVSENVAETADSVKVKVAEAVEAAAEKVSAKAESVKHGEL